MPTEHIKGQQRIFFSRGHSDKPWRLIEKIVAVIELLLHDRDDVLGFSSKRIRNVVGDHEEVDVAFSTIADPTSFFEFIQVRDRDQTEGRPWLEQVIGQQTALGIESCTAVSTEQFADTVLRLASHQGIPVRLLKPETPDRIRKWFTSNFITLEDPHPLIELTECVIVIRVDGQPVKLRGGQQKCLERNVLPHGKEPNTYQEPISLLRVFRSEMARGIPGLDPHLQRIPKDNQLHDLPPVPIGWAVPELSVDYTPPGQPKRVVPVETIVFSARVCKFSGDASIAHRFRYIDAVSNNELAQLVVGDIEVARERWNVCLVRHSCDGKWCRFGGAMFR